MIRFVYVLRDHDLIEVYADPRRAVRALAARGPLAPGSEEAATGLLRLGKMVMVADDAEGEPAAVVRLSVL